MGEKLNHWLEKPLFVYLFGMFFLVFKSSQYFPSFQLNIFILFLILYSAVTYCIIFILARLGLAKYAYILTIIGWILLLYTDEIRYNHFILLFLFITTLITSILRKSSTDFICQLFNKLTNIFVLLLTFFVLVSGLYIYIKERNHQKREPSSFQITTIKPKRDIIWILLDEYSSQSYLSNQFHFHNYLIDSLTKRKFFIFDSIPSRYDFTINSLNSLFNFDDSIEPTNYMYSAKYLSQSRWIKTLQKDGYQFNNLDFLKFEGINKKIELSFFFPYEYFNQIIYNTFFYSFWYFFVTPKEILIDKYNLTIIKHLQNSIALTNNGPTFTWAHLLIPHVPYYRDQNGNINTHPIINTARSSQKEITKQYLNYLQYGNKIVLSLLNQIPNWQNKIIIVSGDHGARMFLANGAPQRFATFAAIYYPGMDTAELKKIKYLQQIPFYLH